MAETTSSGPRTARSGAPKGLENGERRCHIVQQHSQRLVVLLHLRRERFEADFYGAEKALLARRKSVCNAAEIGLPE